MYLASMMDIISRFAEWMPNYFFYGLIAVDISLIIFIILLETNRFSKFIFRESDAED